MKHDTLRWMAGGAIVLLTALVLTGSGRQKPIFEDLAAPGEGKPWTHQRFRNDPDAFQFAIMADRTGGRRPGIFAKAVGKVNLLQPEFVLCVGDLIDGGTTDQAKLAAEWNEFEGMVKKLEMPFFHLSGNHDISNPVMAKVWRLRFGRPYYAFVYRGVLFLCLDSQGPESDGGWGPRQRQWVRRTLAENKSARWTFVFVHKPLWKYDKHRIEKAAKEGKGPPTLTGFADVEADLKGRNYTVFAGHEHTFTKYMRHRQRYFTLGTTGGASGLKGPASGQFDHVVWVTMTAQGPRIANLLLSGILDENVHVE